MRFLLDENLSPRLGVFLRDAGHDVVHVRDIGLMSATDEVVIEAARSERRVLISADTDFGTLLARTASNSPSFVLMRRASGRRAVDQAALIGDEPARVRVRPRGPARSWSWESRPFASGHCPSVVLESFWWLGCRSFLTVPAVR